MTCSASRESIDAAILEVLHKSDMDWTGVSKSTATILDDRNLAVSAFDVRLRVFALVGQGDIVETQKDGDRRIFRRVTPVGLPTGIAL